jgi:hypothetical protein
MVQIQSTWFPVIDRNPQKFVPSIYRATASDFVPATQRIYCSRAMPSHLVLPVMPWKELRTAAKMKQHYARDFQLVMLSELRRQPNEVEAPHVCGQHLRPVEAFPPRLGGALWTVPVRALVLNGPAVWYSGITNLWGRQPMCRNIKTLFNFDPPVTEDEVRAASLQFVRKITGFNKPSKANEAAFAAAIEDVAAISGRLLRSLETNAPPKNREEEAAKAKARAAERFSA